MTCPFCAPAIALSQVILENKHCLFIYSTEAVLVGAGFIIPRQHRESVFELTGVEWQATFALLRLAKGYLDERFKPAGYNLGWNCGQVGGQEVFHAHLHVIPRYEDEPFAGKGIRYWLKQPGNRRSGGAEEPG
jgi:diadenosine tetraphosphate (Ap4A) HIT family hydrolase